MKRLITVILLICIAFTGYNIYQFVSTREKNVAAKVIMECSYPYYDLEDLTSKADIIVQGKIQKIDEPKWNTLSGNKPDSITSEDMIYTDIYLKVDYIVKGDITQDKIIPIRTFCGKTNDFEIVNSSFPQVIKGEGITVFLINDNTIYNKDKKKDHYILLGAEQGLYRNINNEISNVHEKMSNQEFKEKTKYYLNNPKRYENIKSQE